MQGRYIGENRRGNVRSCEDAVSGKRNDARFAKLSADYEAEQADLQNKLKQSQAELTEQEQ